MKTSIEEFYQNWDSEEHSLTEFALRYFKNIHDIECFKIERECFYFIEEGDYSLESVKSLFENIKHLDDFDCRNVCN